MLRNFDFPHSLLSWLMPSREIVSEKLSCAHTVLAMIQSSSRIWAWMSGSLELLTNLGCDITSITSKGLS